MKLFELFPDPGDIMDPLALDDEMNRDKTPGQKYIRGGDAKKEPEGKNMKKAKRITNLAKLKKRERAENTDTPHSYNLGGHGSNFLHR